MNLIETLKDKMDLAGLWRKEFEVKRNEYIKVKGEKDTNIYHVLEGSVRAFIEDEFEEHTIRLGYAGNFISALDSFITEQPSDMYLQALKKTRLLVASKSDYMAFIENSPENMKVWNQLCEQLIYQQMERERDILTRSPKERYERVLKRSPHLFQEIPHKHIASYLRMSPETLSRLKKS